VSGKVQVMLAKPLNSCGRRN